MDVDNMQNSRMNLQDWRMVLNIVLVFIIFRETTIIRSDGPSGFGEAVLKSIVFFLSLIFIFINFIVKSIASYRGKPKPRMSVGDVITTLWAAFFAAISVVDACSDNTGYCRHWNLFSF